MVKRSDKKPSSENYSFIKETIKEHPTDKKSPAKKFLTVAVCGVIFGGCAVGTGDGRPGGVPAGRGAVGGVGV